MEPNKKGLMIGVGLALVAAVGLGIYKMKPAPPPSAPPPPAPTPVSAAIPNAPPSIVLPPLADSDTWVRDRARALSAHPGLASWLGIEDLLRRFVAAAAIVADGKSPRESLKFMKPESRFLVKKKGGKVILDPACYSRYDLAAGVLASLNTELAAGLVRDLKPLLNQAYSELGREDREFEPVLVRAVDHLLRTPVPEGDLELQKKVVSYALADERLENLSAAQKHLLRMGPANASKVKTKLRAFALALGVPENRLPSKWGHPILPKTGGVPG